MKISRILLLTIKQNIKRPSTIMLMAATIICSFFLHNVNNGNTEVSIMSGVYFENPEGIYKDICSEIENYNGIFKFKIYTDPDSLNEDVRLNRIECGYIIHEDLIEEMMDDNILSLIDVVTGPKTTMSNVINETLYSLIYPYIIENALNQYLCKDEVTSEIYGDNLLTQSNIINEYRDTNIFSTDFFNYDGAPDNYKITKETIFNSPIRGFLSLIILLAAFAGTFNYLKLSENLSFKKLPFKLAGITVPTFLTGMMSLICIYILGINCGFLTEITALFLFMIICILYTFIISIFIKKGTTFISLLPLVIIMCIVLSPIIIDISVYVPIVKKLSYLCPTKYYLMFFH